MRTKRCAGEIKNMKKQNLALAAIGIAGLVLMGTAVLSVARSGNDTSAGFGNRYTTMTLAADTGMTQKMAYMTRPQMSMNTCSLGDGVPNGNQTSNHSDNGRSGHHGRMMNHHRNHPIEPSYMGCKYLNTTRLEGLLEYNDGTYFVDTTVLYLGNDVFLKSLAQSDYDRDGTYEYIEQELEGLQDTVVVVNGVLENNSLYVTHINGIWLRNPILVEITEIQGYLTYDNKTGSYFVNDTEIILKKQGFSLSDIDGDGSLEPLWGEIDGLAGEIITVDGTLLDETLVVEHINGVWVR